MEKEKRCHFYTSTKDFKGCGLLADTQCSGWNYFCTFKKTSAQFMSDQNDAIRKCREKGLCNSCKYTTPYTRCKLWKINKKMSGLLNAEAEEDDIYGGDKTNCQDDGRLY